MGNIVYILLFGFSQLSRSTDAIGGVAQCYPPGDRDNAHRPKHTGHYNRNDIVTYNCNDGYWAREQRQIQCTFYGDEWTVIVEGTGCKALCEPLPSIKNGEVSQKREHYVEGESVRFDCDEGYVLDGSDSMTCKSNIWTPPIPKCIAMVVSTSRHTTVSQENLDGRNSVESTSCAPGADCSEILPTTSSQHEDEMMPTTSSVNEDETMASTILGDQHETMPTSIGIDEYGHTTEDRREKLTGNNRTVAIILIVTITVVLVVVGIAVYCYKRKQRRDRTQTNANINTPADSETVEPLNPVDQNTTDHSDGREEVEMQERLAESSSSQN